MKEWQPNDRLPTIKDLARNLETGQSSTYQAVKELVREGILVSKPRLGTFVNDNLAAIKPKLEMMLQDKMAPAKAPLAGKKIQLITYKPAFTSHAFVPHAIDAFTQTITEAGGDISTTFIEDSIIDDMEPLLDKQAHGVAVFNPVYFLPTKCLSNQVLTVIKPSCQCTIAATERFDLIAVDDTQGSMLAGEFFRQKGCKDVCFLGVKYPTDPEHYDKVSAMRLEGLALGLGMPIRPEWQLSCISFGSFDAIPAIQDWLKLDPRPYAVFAASDDVAYGFIYGAIAHGLFPGKDFQIMGFDGQLDSPFADNVTLTSIAIPISEMGTVAAKTLMKRLKNPTLTPQRIYLGCKLFEGNTVISRP
jgi:DNA-binding LacI/PurR family transcriptional regulator